MPAGFYAANAENIVQIDATYKNYYLKEKGTVQVTWGNVDVDAPPGFVKSVVIVDNAVNPVLAFCCLRNMRVWRTQLGPNRFQFDYVPDDMDFGKTRPFPMEYFIFDSPQPIPAEHGIGMQIYTEEAQLAFDTNMQFMKVIGAITQNATFPATGAGLERVFRFSNNKTAVLTCQQAIKVLLTFEQVGPGGQDVEFMELYTLTPRVDAQGTITTVDRLCYSRRTPVLQNVTRSQSYILAIDVSNIF